MTPEEKIEQLQALLAEDQEDHLAHFMLGKMLLDAGRNEDAAAALERSLELRPDYSAAYRFCGDAYRKAGNREKARAVYEKGIKIADENGDLQTVKEMQAFLRKLDK